MPIKSFESPESASPIVTSAVAKGLLGEYCDNYTFPSWQNQLLLALGLFPQEFARIAISRFQTISGLSPNILKGFSIENLILERLSVYAQSTKKYDCISMGAALGGATSYLSLALDGPFLPETFVITLKGGSPKGDVNQFFNRSAKQALKIAEDHPGLITIQHYDPIHDGWLTRFVNHLRFKLVSLPPAYTSFIRNKLKPGGSLVYLEGQAEWLRYRVGPRSFFQVGGWGGISAQEFLEGSPRIQQYAREVGFETSQWKLDGFPLESGPESEWGSEPAMAKSLEEFCRTEGYQFVHIRLPHPNDFSRLAFNVAHFLLMQSNQSPAGVLVETFSQFDSMAALRSGLLPLWLVFNTWDSLEYLKEMITKFPVDKPVFFSPLATFSLTPDLVPWKDWESAMSGLNWINIGTRPSHYPCDSRAVVKWSEPLRNWVSVHQRPLSARISAIQLLELANQLK
jgi:hypothetical protein